MHCQTKEITDLHALWYTNSFNSLMNYDKSRLVYLEVKCAYMRAHKLLMSIWCTKVLYLYDSPGEIHSLFARVVLCQWVEQLILGITIDARIPVNLGTQARNTSHGSIGIHWQWSSWFTVHWVGLVKSFQLQLHIKSLCPNVGAKMLQSLFIITDNKDICMVRLFVSGHSDFKICNVYLSPFYGNRLIIRTPIAWWD